MLQRVITVDSSYLQSIYPILYSTANKYKQKQKESKLLLVDSIMKLASKKQKNKHNAA